MNFNHLKGSRSKFTLVAFVFREIEMSAYCLFDNLKVTDPAALEVYKKHVGPIVAKFSGRYVVLGGQCEIVEGDWKPTYPVMIEFPRLEDARNWYQSEEYDELKTIRLNATKSNAVFIEGI